LRATEGAAGRGLRELRWATNQPAGGPPSAIVSSIYASDDDGLLKIGVSCPILGDRNQLLGVIAGMIAGDDLVRGMGGASASNEWRWGGTTSLAGRFDRNSTNNTLQADYALFLHLGQGTTNANLVSALRIDHPKVKELLGTHRVAGVEWDTTYRDPYPGPEAAGLWTAVFARVGEHPLVVIYQKRNLIATVLIPLVLAVVVITIGLWWGMARRAQARRSG
jgi:hypothetical protein